MWRLDPITSICLRMYGSVCIEFNSAHAKLQTPQWNAATTTNTAKDLIFGGTTRMIASLVGGWIITTLTAKCFVANQNTYSSPPQIKNRPPD